MDVRRLGIEENVVFMALFLVACDSAEGQVSLEMGWKAAEATIDGYIAV
jgi:hypothetical protein